MTVGKVLVARPRKEFDQTQFEKLCAIQCTEVEIAAWFDMSIDTLNARCHETYGECFADVFKKHSVDGKMSIRRNQFRLSEKNTAMAIWLGKQYLGQRDDSFYTPANPLPLTIKIEKDTDEPERQHPTETA